MMVCSSTAPIGAALFVIGRSVMFHQTGGFGVFRRMHRRYMDPQGVRTVKALAAMFATDALELARRGSGGWSTFDVPQMLFQTTLREVSPTVLTLRIFRAFSSSHFLLSDDQPVLHRTRCDGNRKLACAFD